MGALHDDVGNVGAQRSTTVLVQFGPLTEAQMMLVDLHTLRALGSDSAEPIAGDGVVVEFWLRDGDGADALYDDIRGWAIGNGLPVRGIVAS